MYKQIATYDDYLAALTLWGEARGEPFEALCGVGEVIRNRMNRKYMSNGVLIDTIFKPMQFPVWNSFEPARAEAFKVSMKDPVLRKCFSAWLASEFTGFAKGAVHYLPQSEQSVPNWATEEYSLKLATIGTLFFFKPKDF